MERDKILLLGTGQCGCILVNDMIKRNQRYAGIFLNSSLGDLSNLEHAKESNTFVFNGTDGAGGYRDLAKTFVQDDFMRMSTFLVKFKQFKVITIFSSLDGGTGSGSLPLIIKLLKAKLFPDVIINLVGVLPSLTEDKLKLENTLECLRDLDSVSQYLNNIRFINNNTRKEYSEINYEAVKMIDMSYSIMGKNAIGNIDLQDSKNVNLCQGYGVTLSLPDRNNNIKESIRVAIENSVFALPESLECIYGAINVKANKYDVNEIKDYFYASERIYSTCNDDKFNCITLGGCDLPENVISLIKTELEDRKRTHKDRKVNMKFGINYNTTNTNNFSNKSTINQTIEDDDLDIDPDFFRL